MKAYKEHDQAICRRHRAISLLLGNDPAVLDFLFDRNRTCLNDASETIRKEASLLSPPEELLAKIALDIWDESGHAKLTETYRILPDYRYECFMLAMEYLGTTAYNGCKYLRCRASNQHCHPESDVVNYVCCFHQL